MARYRGKFPTRVRHAYTVRRGYRVQLNDGRTFAFRTPKAMTDAELPAPGSELPSGGKLAPYADFQSFAVIIRCTSTRGPEQADALDELEARGLWLSEAQRKAAGVTRKRAGLGPKRKPWEGRLPVRDDVLQTTYHRPPTPWELRFGEGATHYATFDRGDMEEFIFFPGTSVAKRWFVSPYDGLRYYR